MLTVLTLLFSLQIPPPEGATGTRVPAVTGLTGPGAPRQTARDVVELHRQKYGDALTVEDAPQLLREIAAALNVLPATGHLAWGRLIKLAGNACGGWACDIVCSVDPQTGATLHYDVFIDGPDATQGHAGEARPTWREVGPIAKERCDLVSFDPPPPPPPPPPDLSKLIAQLVALSGEVATLRNSLSLLGQDLDHLQERVTVLEQAETAARIDTLERALKVVQDQCVVGRIWGVVHFRGCPER